MRPFARSLGRSDWYSIGTRARLRLIGRVGRFPAVKGNPLKVSDGTRTRDRLDHNQELYQLSYAHRARSNVAVAEGADGTIERFGLP